MTVPCSVKKPYQPFSNSLWGAGIGHQVNIGGTMLENATRQNLSLG
jgi:hypothetical protein